MSEAVYRTAPATPGLLNIDSCDISDNSDSNNSSDSRQEQTCFQDFVIVCISNRHY